MGFEEFFKELMGEEPYSHQREAFRRLREGEGPWLLRAPTGSGKTEAAVLPWLWQFRAREWFLAPRLIYVLPTRALVESVRERIERLAERVSDKLVVKAQHGQNPADPFLFSDAVVTTLDQFIYLYSRSLTQGRHSEIPAGDIAHSFVVFDEAHMYSPYTYGLMHAAFEILEEAKVPFLVMTATMPESLERDFKKPVLRRERDWTEIEFDEESFYAQRQDLAQREVKLERVDEEALSDEAFERVEGSLKEGKRVLAVLNTVGRAQEFYRRARERFRSALKPGENLVLVHSRFLPEDRKRKEERIRELLGQEGVGPALVVATQVVEAGLDISADALLTELAPADSLVQRAGRVARWGGRGVVWVFSPPKKDDSKDYEVEPYPEEFMEHARGKLREVSEISRWGHMQALVDDLPACVDFAASSSAAWHLLEDSILLATEKPRPQDIAVREGKSVLLVPLPEGVSEEEAERMPGVSVGFNYAYRKFKEGTLREVLRPKGKKKELRGDAPKPSDFKPWDRVFVPAHLYDPEEGLRL